MGCWSSVLLHSSVIQNWPKIDHNQVSHTPQNESGGFILLNMWCNAWLLSFKAKDSSGQVFSCSLYLCASTLFFHFIQFILHTTHHPIISTCCFFNLHNSCTFFSPRERPFRNVFPLLCIRNIKYPPIFVMFNSFPSKYDMIDFIWFWLGWGTLRSKNEHKCCYTTDKAGTW